MLILYYYCFIYTCFESTTYDMISRNCFSSRETIYSSHVLKRVFYLVSDKGQEKERALIQGILNFNLYTCKTS